ncbi:MAG: AAA family ATPase, partial [Chloroflexota bacterium]|nr:AAA family ATPase [Chloroflexota bacterium]
MTLSDHQRALVERPIERKLFLAGPAGTGKTTAGVERLLHLLEEGVPGDSILVITPQRTLAAPYYDALRRATVRPGGQVTVLTVGGLAQRTVDLFWPLVVEEAGFGHLEDAPTFLTLETAQYYMARLVRPLLEQGYFETITIDRNRLYSQILDNLNKAAVVGFPHTEIGARLKSAWGGEQSQRRIYDEAQECAALFRRYCLAHNLLDFSLQLEVFIKHLWTMPLCRNYLLETYSHLIADNVEEDTPVAHDLLRDWLPHYRSALLIHDREAG